MSHSLLRKHRRRHGPLLLVGIVATALLAAGCSNSSGTPTGGESPSGPRTLVVWDPLYNDPSNWKTVLAEYDKKFEAAHPGLTVQHVSVPASPPEYTAKLRAAVTGNAAPDVALLLPGGHGVFNFTKALLPLDAVAAPLQSDLPSVSRTVG